MKRDIDLIRNILLAIEAAEPTTESKSLENIINEHGKDVTNYHVSLLVEAGYILESADMTAGNEYYKSYIIHRLTWEGHEFLDAAKDNKVWEKTKNILSPIASVSVDVLKVILVQVAKDLLNIS